MFPTWKGNEKGLIKDEADIKTCRDFDVQTYLQTRRWLDVETWNQNTEPEKLI